MKTMMFLCELGWGQHGDVCRNAAEEIKCLVRKVFWLEERYYNARVVDEFRGSGGMISEDELGPFEAKIIAEIAAFDAEEAAKKGKP